MRSCATSEGPRLSSGLASMGRADAGAGQAAAFWRRHARAGWRGLARLVAGSERS